MKPGKTDTILDVEGLLVGQAEDPEALTGVTVVIAPAGATAGVSVRGGGSGTRETTLLDPQTTVDNIHAIVLSGGSAFGLDAAGGVMSYLEEKGIGFDVTVTKVPLVPQAILFDLAVGSAKVRPDKDMGYAACQNASSTHLSQGSVGAGCGATIGKLMGAEFAMKSGIGSASCVLDNGFCVAAIVAVNAMGDVYENGQIIAGLLDKEGRFADTSRQMLIQAGQLMEEQEELLSFQKGKNTTIGIIATNGRFTKAQAAKIADMGHQGLVRAIRPAHTTVDGDTLFAMATGQMKGSVDAAGEMAAIAVERAIIKAVKAATSAANLPAWRDLPQNKSSI